MNNKAYAARMFADAELSKLRHLVINSEVARDRQRKHRQWSKSVFNLATYLRGYPEDNFYSGRSHANLAMRVITAQNRRMDTMARKIQRAYRALDKEAFLERKKRARNAKVAALGKVVFKGPHGEPVTLPYSLLTKIRESM
jgi:hypothetical protein